jgi:hypothetical protein
MRPNQIYVNGIITNYKPFKKELPLLIVYPLYFILFLSAAFVLFGWAMILDSIINH